MIDALLLDDIELQPAGCDQYFIDIFIINCDGSGVGESNQRLQTVAGDSIDGENWIAISVFRYAGGQWWCEQVFEEIIGRLQNDTMRNDSVKQDGWMMLEIIAWKSNPIRDFVWGEYK